MVSILGFLFFVFCLFLFFNVVVSVPYLITSVSGTETFNETKISPKMLMSYFPLYIWKYFTAEQAFLTMYNILAVCLFLRVSQMEGLSFLASLHRVSWMSSNSLLNHHTEYLKTSHYVLELCKAFLCMLYFCYTGLEFCFEACYNSPKTKNAKTIYIHSFSLLIHPKLGPDSPKRFINLDWVWDL